MHIKNIHSMIEKLSECAKCELDKGIEKIDTEEMSEVAEIIKELTEAEYYATVTKAMEEHDFENEEEIMEEGRKGYRGRSRDSMGRFTSRGRGRRGYEMPMMIYDENWDEMERMRDMDRPIGRMGYSGSGSMGGSQGQSGSGSLSMGGGQSNGGSMSNTRGYSESRYDRARRGYEESKAMHKSGSVEDKKKNMESLERYMKELSEEMAELIESMDANEKTMVRSKLQTLAQKVQ